MKVSPIGAIPTEEAEEVEFHEKVEEAAGENPRSVINLLSDYVLDLLELLEIPSEQVEEELEARMQLIKTQTRPEDLIVHLCSIAKRLIDKQPVEEDHLEPTAAQVRLNAAKMTMCFLALLL